MSESSLTSIADDLNEVNWSEIYGDDVDTGVMKFSRILNDLYCKYCPLKVKYVSAKRFQKPWITPVLLDRIKDKSYRFKLFKLGFISRTDYNIQRNMVNRSIENAKKNYHKTYRIAFDL